MYVFYLVESISLQIVILKKIYIYVKQVIQDSNRG